MDLLSTCCAIQIKVGKMSHCLVHMEMFVHIPAPICLDFDINKLKLMCFLDGISAGEIFPQRENPDITVGMRGCESLLLCMGTDCPPPPTPGSPFVATPDP